jgi:hypothetical protein
MSSLNPFVDATVTVLAGLWATHLGWHHPALSGPPHTEHAEYWRAERCIGPLLIAVAVVEFALILG